jgi:hypothetical protein
VTHDPTRAHGRCLTGQNYLKNVNALLKAPLSLPDPLTQMVTVPNFYLSFFGENDVETYKSLASVMLAACPG